MALGRPYPDSSDRSNSLIKSRKANLAWRLRISTSQEHDPPPSSFGQDVTTLNSKRILARDNIAAVAEIALSRWVTLALQRGACPARLGVN